eukprot:6189965-Pleurochrysis_carterae.AAC.2
MLDRNVFVKACTRGEAGRAIWHLVSRGFVATSLERQLGRRQHNYLPSCRIRSAHLTLRTCCSTLPAFTSP